jgi:murein DD-endopeptidase MepM/ murein hydrolase activator NlpD
MKKIFFGSVIVFGFLLNSFDVSAKEIAVSPDNQVLQGEPVKFELRETEFRNVERFVFDGKEYLMTKLKNRAVVFVGIDIKKTPGVYRGDFVLKNGSVVSKEIFVLERPRLTETFQIPKSLGGNTKKAALNVVSNLAKENAILDNLKSEPTTLWKKSFRYPLDSVTVTDVYGYSRDTSSVVVTHRGTDFRAITGTKVFAMNDGVVALADSLTVYGNTVVIDHGAGLKTFYMHLSSINVTAGQRVRQGDLLGLSGQTGYSLAPHLHLSVRLQNTSIDPVVFMSLF